MVSIEYHQRYNKLVRNISVQLGAGINGNTCRPIGTHPDYDPSPLEGSLLS